MIDCPKCLTDRYKVSEVQVTVVRGFIHTYIGKNLLFIIERRPYVNNTASCRPGIERFLVTRSSVKLKLLLVEK